MTNYGGDFSSVGLQGAEGSVQALYNGFAGSLHGPGQAPNQAQHFHHPQVVYLIRCYNNQ